MEMEITGRVMGGGGMREKVQGLRSINASYFLIHLSPFSLPTDNPPCDLHFCDSVPILVVCLVCFCFYFLGSAVDSCEFVVILLFIVFDLFLR